MSSFISYNQQGAIGTITISRPEALNALSREVLSELLSVIDQLTKKKDLRVVVLTGAGKAFVAGADVKQMHDSDAAAIHTYVELGQKVMCAIEALSVPVIAKVNGFALGGGMELALACDVIIASEKAKVGQPEVNLGIVPGFGGTQRLMRRAGIGVAKRLILGGEVISAQEAASLGVIEKVVPAETLDAEVQRYAELVASKGPRAVQEAKRILNQAQDLVLPEGLNLEAQQFEKLFATADRAEGMKAFFEKRPPGFKGN